MAGRVGPGGVILMVTLVTLRGPTMPSTWGAEDTAHPERLEAARDPRRISRDVKLDVKVVKTKAEFVPLEPVQLEITARNVSTDHRVISGFRGDPPEGDYRVFPIKVFDSNGELVSSTRFAEDDLIAMGLPRGGGLGFQIHLDPGKTYHCTLVANMVRDMTSPDVYTILVEFPIGEKLIDGKEVELVGQSDPIKVKVLADPRRKPAFWQRPERAVMERYKRETKAHREQLNEELRKEAAKRRP